MPQIHLKHGSPRRADTRSPVLHCSAHSSVLYVLLILHYSAHSAVCYMPGRTTSDSCVQTCSRPRVLACSWAVLYCMLLAVPLLPLYCLLLSVVCRHAHSCSVPVCPCPSRTASSCPSKEATFLAVVEGMLLAVVEDMLLSV